MKKCPRDTLLQLMRTHTCQWKCLVRAADAAAAGVIPHSAQQPDDFGRAPVMRPSRPSRITGPSGSSRPLTNEQRSSNRAQQRAETAARMAEGNSADVEWWRLNWPQEVSNETLKDASPVVFAFKVIDSFCQIIREHRDQTSAANLSRGPCSFCNRNELSKNLKCFEVDDLDITILDAAVCHLRDVHRQPAIRSHALYNGRYQCCPSCRKCITKGKFVSLPMLSWANDCWVGPVPSELQSLTYAEELVIARAHTTKCWARITSGSSSGPLAQRAAHGNVCVHPHEISKLATVLPRPMSTLYDEIVVIFVSDNQEATSNIFERTPLLVRRGHILRALEWLKRNNPLYSDITIDYEALKEYPADGRVPFPVHRQAANGTIRSQSSTYTGHGIDTTESIFASQADETDLNSVIPITTSGTFDVDETESSLNHRKIAALQHLRSGGAFVKTSTSVETIATRNNPQVYGMLWPTLFPYGVGMFEDPVRLAKVDGHDFKPIPLKTHVSRYLQLADRRFQTHLTFIFAMHNIQMLRASSYMSRLAVRRAWWPRAMDAMGRIDAETLNNVETAMAIKKARKDHSPCAQLISFLINF